MLFGQMEVGQTYRFTATQGRETFAVVSRPTRNRFVLLWLDKGDERSPAVEAFYLDEAALATPMDGWERLA